jgi:hypothetical protein
MRPPLAVSELAVSDLEPGRDGRRGRAVWDHCGSEARNTPTAPVLCEPPHGPPKSRACRAAGMRRAPTTVALLLALSTVASTAGGDASYDQVSRGLHLARLGDDLACRTAPGAKPFARGVVAATPIGNPLGADVMPDPAARIAGQDFPRAVSAGIGEDGTRLDGAARFITCTKVTSRDNAALWDYVQTVEPVIHPFTSNRLPLPFN